jgi:gamma-butyrobetaine dioxygenase
MTSGDAVAVLAGLFASEGAAQYLGEPVTQAGHMLQAAALAERDRAGEALIAAALLHDVGHLAVMRGGRDRALARGDRHGGDQHGGDQHGGDQHGGDQHGDDQHGDDQHGDDQHGDDQHEENGAAWLSQWFGDEVTEPVRLHVPAKRYLCAVEPDYAAGLSPASAFSLEIQGGPMPPAELAEFEASPYAPAAIQVRRWDDVAKDPAARVPGFDHFAGVLRALVR